jgi:tRNA threonylcarbamoyladenosine biosynthesis protein TsaE
VDLCERRGETLQEFVLNSVEETQSFGIQLGKLLFPGSIVLLYGDLGTGKTTLTKGIAKGLGITVPVTSPTFTIVQEYGGGRLPLYHIDTYRLGDPDELLEIGIEEYLNSSGVTVIEWPEVISDFLPGEYLELSLARAESITNDVRILSVKGTGENHLNIVKEMVKGAGTGNR